VYVVVAAADNRHPRENANEPHSHGCNDSRILLSFDLRARDGRPGFIGCFTATRPEGRKQPKRRAHHAADQSLSYSPNDGPQAPDEPGL